jgi:hypothetical protein
MLTLADIDKMPSVSSSLMEPPRQIRPVAPRNPAALGYPVTLPIEIALRTSPVESILEGYGISEEEWDLIRYDPTFINDLQRAADMLKEEGMSFRVKAKLQAEELLHTSWRMIHDVNAPPAVRADLIKATMRWAQYDVPPSQQTLTPGSGFSININFSGNGKEPRLINGPY